ncbi:hypothetical protein ES319_D06G161300v1 [Gossypium barbadense]|uniref:Uncharacterized protein n=2 Tax=Gossypium TaxID=3633 RepID=A0A5J5R9X0_GOSBA|nr:hypothetical protein ES319_D06G161300v1 [Gossypium barbadense]TYG65265.1 hypothetical protein ES288_D06G172200v1 [Gossypium darwinii]
MLLPLNPMLNDMQLVGLKGSVEGFSSTVESCIAATFNEIRDAAWNLMKDPSFHFYIAC